jgi:hypothetical protein
MENANDDPRVFAHDGNGHANDMDPDGMPPGFPALICVCLHDHNVLEDLSPHNSGHAGPDGQRDDVEYTSASKVNAKFTICKSFHLIFCIVY